MNISRHNFSPVILREYDIRGIVGENLSEDDACALGLSYGTHIRRNGGGKICVGYDGRLTSAPLADALMRGLSGTGLDVVNIGLGPTPMLYFSVWELGADAGIMVTGSHNPSEYNGFKMMYGKGPFYGAMIQGLGRLAATGDFERGAGSIRETDVRGAYVKRLLKDYSASLPLKVAWDAGNGAAGEILRRITAQLPGEHILLFDQIDGSFPNHHPDPTVDENLADLRKAVLENKCDLGIAFDGDGDRIGALDQNGAIIRGDALMAIYARPILEKNPGATIIGDVKCSRAMFDEIRRMGGQPLMWKTGGSLVRAKMAEIKAPFAGEFSGHIFFGDIYYGYDDGLYCAIRLLNEVSAAPGGLAALANAFPKLYSTPEIRIDVDESEKFDLARRAAASVRKNYHDAEIIDIDGIRVSSKDGWWLLRASNTQNALVARAEASTEKGLGRLKEMLKTEIKNLGYNIIFPE